MGADAAGSSCALGAPGASPYLPSCLGWLLVPREGRLAFLGEELVGGEEEVWESEEMLIGAVRW